MLKQRIIIGLAVLPIFFALPPSPLPGMLVEQVVAVVDGEPYTLSDLKDFARVKLRREFPTDDFAHMGEKDKEVLEQFITEKLSAAEAKRLGIKVSEKDVDGYVAKVKERTQINDPLLREALRREGVDMKQYRASIRAELEKGQLINRQVRKKVNITPEDVKRYYRVHSKRFMTRDKVHLRHILIRIRGDGTPEEEKAAVSKALEIRELALQGRDFTQLAREYSGGGRTAKGGDIGWVDRTSLLKEIANVAFEMSQGEISQPVRSSLGIHLLKLEGRQPAKLLPLSQVQSKIKEELYAKALDERFQKWLKTDLRRKHRVDVKLPGFVFRAEETKEGTVNTLMASAPGNGSSDSEEPGFWSYVNPLYYIMTETPIEGETGENLEDEKLVSFFGVPLFVTESPDDLEEELVIQSEQGEGKDESEESQGFFSSVWDSINPF